MAAGEILATRLGFASDSIEPFVCWYSRVAPPNQSGATASPAGAGPKLMSYVFRNVGFADGVHDGDANEVGGSDV